MSQNSFSDNHKVDTNIYFINYKNSVQGTGGVGTVSRDLIKYYPDIHFIYWDGSKINRSNDLGIDIPQQLHTYIHTKYAKLYLWPVLHGLPSKINADDLLYVRKQAYLMYEMIAKEIVKFAQTNSQQGPSKIYWLNDYTSIPIVGPLRNLDKDATIIFTFRTPFGVKDRYPVFFDEEIPLFEKLLQADCVTFHRKSDLERFLAFINDKVSIKIKISPIQDRFIISLPNQAKVILLVVPMGNNKDYRRSLLNQQITKQFYKKLKSNYLDKIIITGISRFEESKGIEHEINIINWLLQMYPDVIEKFVFLRYSYLSENKKRNAEYNFFKEKVITKIHKINAQFGTDKWQPIIYDFSKKLNNFEVTGLLMASDILLIASYADGFNHLALEAIYSQKRTGYIQLLLSDIGVTDYIRGYKKLTLDAKVDAQILYNALWSNKFKNWFNQQQLNLSARKLSSKKWILQIIKTAKEIRSEKYDKSCCNNTSK